MRIERIPLHIGFTTLVGHFNSGSPPYVSGNCVSIGGKGCNYACSNMHGENVTAALIKWPELSEGVEVEVMVDAFGRGICRIIDERIPQEWLQHSCDCCRFPG